MLFTQTAGMTTTVTINSHLLHGVFDDALGLVEQRQPRGYDGLLEQPGVLRRAVVVDPVD